MAMEVLHSALDTILRSPYSPSVGLAIAAVGLTSLASSARRHRHMEPAAQAQPQPQPQPMRAETACTEPQAACVLPAIQQEQPEAEAAADVSQPQTPVQAGMLPAGAGLRAQTVPDADVACTPRHLDFGGMTSASSTDSLRSMSPSAMAEAETIDYLTGAEAVRRTAELLSDTVFVYSLATAASDSSGDATMAVQRPSSFMELPAPEARLNLLHHLPVVKTIDTRAGAGSVILGALAGGMQHVSVLAPSSALPHMIPALHQLARRGAPVVLHVATAALSAQDLSLTPDMADVLATRHTGMPLLLSFNGQESQDMALVAHHSRLPVLHAYDALQTGETETDIRRADLHHLASVYTATSPGGPPSRGITAGAVARLDQSMAALAPVLGRRYRPYEYSGPVDASIVVVVLGHGTPVVQQAVQQMNRNSHTVHKMGVLAIRVYRPWSVEHFLAALPRSALLISVSDCTLPAGQEHAQHSALFADVAASFHTSVWQGTKPVLVNNSIAGDHNGLTLEAVRAALATLVHSADAHDLNLDDERSSVQLSLWGASATMGAVAKASGRALRDQGFVTKSLTSEDHLAGACDATRVRLLVAHAGTAGTARLVLAQADAVICHDATVFEQHMTDILAELKPYGQLVLCFDPSHLRLPRTLHLTVIDTKSLAQQAAALLQLPAATLNQAACHLATLTAANRFFPFVVGPDGVGVQQLHGLDAALDALAPEVAEGFIAQVQSSLVDIVFSSTPMTTDAASGAPVPALPTSSAFRPRLRVGSAASKSSASNVGLAPAVHEAAAHHVCWKLMFPEAYASESGLRPGQEGIFRVKLTKNKRLTPLDYDRNVFHLEMDITGTGLTYEIGDALGVYAHNEAAEVDAFLEFYRLQRDTFVSLETASGQHELMSVEKLFEQRLDIFGKPPKKFYAALAGFALDPYEQKRLKWLGSEDAEGFKLRQLEAVTYADLLREFPSAHPPLSMLVQLIPPIKPRHYSIASSMKMCPNSVHLLVVQVGWTTPKGRKRYGQCTRYLANLRPEHYEVYITVDIKPSVMRLPEDPRTPVIMAGLGTGMAPFRAFLQERAFLRSQGTAVGPMTLYFGARYRADEYLYGDELDQYAADGLLTHLRLAFSRDQKAKVYIQDKIKEDKTRLYSELHELQGSFYLCGPTWPVPDVRNALQASLVETGGQSPDQADDTIEQWKENGRYILEVY